MLTKAKSLFQLDLITFLWQITLFLKHISLLGFYMAFMVYFRPSALLGLLSLSGSLVNVVGSISLLDCLIPRSDCSYPLDGTQIYLSTLLVF